MGDSKATNVSTEANASTSPARLRGRKPAKRHASAGSAEATSAASAADGPGQHLDLEPRGDAPLHEDVAGVADQRHPGVRHQRDHRAVPHAVDELGRPLALVVLVVGDERRLHAVALEQDAGAARVLAGDHVGVAQRRQHAQGHVLEVPDRRRADHQPAGLTTARASSRASTAAPIMPASAPKPPPRRAPCRAPAAARAGASPRAPGSSSISPAAITPPPITITSGSKMFTRLARPTPSCGRCLDRAARDRVAVVGELGHERAGELQARGQRAAQRRLRLPRARASGASRTSAEPEATASRHRGSGSCPGTGGPSASTTMWPSSPPAPCEPRYTRRRGSSRRRCRCPSVSITTFAPPRRAEPVLGQHRAGRVVVHHHRQAEALGHESRERQVRRSAGASSRPRCRRASIVHGMPNPTAATVAGGVARLLHGVAQISSSSAWSSPSACRRARWWTARSGPTAPARSLVPPRSTPTTQPLGASGAPYRSTIPGSMAGDRRRAPTTVHRTTPRQSRCRRCAATTTRSTTARGARAPRRAAAQTPPLHPRRRPRGRAGAAHVAAASSPGWRSR